MYKKIGKSCDKINASSKSDSEVKKCKSESEYQRISDATSQNIKALVHETRSSPSSPKAKNKGKLPAKPPKKKVGFSSQEMRIFFNTIKNIVLPVSFMKRIHWTKKILVMEMLQKYKWCRMILNLSDTFISNIPTYNRQTLNTTQDIVSSFANSFSTAFLSGRKQYVKCLDFVCEVILPVTSRMLQGSILGPFLFINDIILL